MSWSIAFRLVMLLLYQTQGDNDLWTGTRAATRSAIRITSFMPRPISVVVRTGRRTQQAFSDGGLWCRPKHQMSGCVWYNCLNNCMSLCVCVLWCRRRGQRWMTWEALRCRLVHWKKSSTTIMPLCRRRLAASTTSAFCHLLTKISLSPAALCSLITRSAST